MRCKERTSLLLDSIVCGTFWNNLWLLASQGSIINNLALSAGDKTGVAIDAGDEPSTISNGESGVRPEFIGESSRLNLVGTTEADNLLWVTMVQQEVRPVAGVSLIIIGKSRLTWGLVWDSVGALDIRSVTGVGFWVDSELVVTSRGRDGC